MSTLSRADVAGPAAQCPVCSAPEAPRRRVVPSPYQPPRTEYAIHACRACGHQFALGPSDAASLARVYSGAFHSTAQQHASGPDSPIVVNAERRARDLAAAGLQGRLLDIGAGKGYFVRAASRHFEATGIEYSAQAAEAARADGLRVLTGAFPDTAPTGPFDVVTLWDVLAGLAELHGAVAKVAELLAPQGRLVFTVPLVSSRAARWLGRWWPLLVPPVNLHYFTQDSIERLLRAHGLRIDRTGTETKRVALQFLARKALRAARLQALEPLAAALPRGWAIPLDLGDILTVHAVKTPR